MYSPIPLAPLHTGNHSIWYLCEWLFQIVHDIITYSKNISDVKKGESKKVQVTERLKVWNYCEAKKKRYTSKVV